MDIVKLIGEVEDIPDKASTAPFSKKVMVERRELLSVLGDMRESLPEEIRQAQWTNAEKNRIVDEASGESESIRTQACREAGKIDQEARNRFETTVNEHNVTIVAQKNMEEITSQVENNARLLRSQPIQCIGEILKTTRNKLHNLLGELQKNGNELGG